MITVRIPKGKMEGLGNYSCGNSFDGITATLEMMRPQEIEGYDIYVEIYNK